MWKKIKARKYSFIKYYKTKIFTLRYTFFWNANNLISKLNTFYLLVTEKKIITKTITYITHYLT